MYAQALHAELEAKIPRNTQFLDGFNAFVMNIEINAQSLLENLCETLERCTEHIRALENRIEECESQLKSLRH